jgi:hypothetical protein
VAEILWLTPLRPSLCGNDPVAHLHRDLRRLHASMLVRTQDMLLRPALWQRFCGPHASVLRRTGG